MLEQLIRIKKYVFPMFQQVAINIGIAVLIWIVGRKVIKWVKVLINKGFDRHQTDITVRKFLNSCINYILHTILFLIILNQIGIPTASVVAAIGSAGLAVGLALQGSLSNLAGGVLILLLRPFRVGDYIVEDTKKNEGSVESIGIFYTTLLTPDNKKVVIPNGILANNSLTNVTGQTQRRLDVKVGISYDSDIKLAKTIMEDLLVKQDARVREKELLVVVSELASSNVVIEGRMWVEASAYWKTRWYLLEEIKIAYDKAGIEIPYQKLDVNILEKK